MLAADPVPLSGQDLVDEGLHQERYGNLKDDQSDDVEAQEVQPHEPVKARLGCKPLLHVNMYTYMYIHICMYNEKIWRAGENYHRSAGSEHFTEKTFMYGMLSQLYTCRWV